MNTIKAIDVKEGQLVMFFDEKTKSKKLLVRGDFPGDGITGNPTIPRLWNKTTFSHVGDIMDTIDGKDQFVMSPIAMDIVCLKDDQTVQPVHLSLIVQ
jgi:hypothetical protein